MKRTRQIIMFFEVFDCADIFLGIILQKDGASFLWSSVACKLVAICRTKIPTVPQAPVCKKSNREVLEKSETLRSSTNYAGGLGNTGSLEGEKNKKDLTWTETSRFQRGLLRL